MESGPNDVLSVGRLMIRIRGMIRIRSMIRGSSMIRGGSMKQRRAGKYFNATKCDVTLCCPLLYDVSTCDVNSDVTSHDVNSDVTSHDVINLLEATSSSVKT